METTTKLFWQDDSQVVRIPDAYRFNGVTEVIIRKGGRCVGLGACSQNLGIVR